MRQPQRYKGQAKQQVSNVVSNSAPVGGWNARDSIANMKPGEALVLDNFFPQPSYVEIRGGSVSHKTGMTGTGKTLAIHNGITGTNKMFCSTQSGVYDVTSPGAVGASVAARTNGKHQSIMFGDGTSNWLIMVNGVDKPLYYDGTTWTAVDGATSPALTGLTTTTLVGVCEHKGRLIFIQQNTLAFWYLPSGVAGGALTKFDLSGVAQKGGYLQAIATWTVDAGSGGDDRLAFITSEGEVIVYAGTNPSAAATWGLVGVYTIGRPIGRRCLTKVGGDILIITENGIFSIASVLGESGVNYSNAISDKIAAKFRDSALTYKSNFGWKLTLFPSQTALLINIPLAEDGVHHQYVMNTITKSWCRFIGWDAEDMVDFNGGLYYCQGTKVIQAWIGVSDQGANIDAYAKCAFNYFGNNTQLKRFKMFRPMLLVNGSISYLIDIDVDFADNDITGLASYTITPQALWDTSTWDFSYWASGMQIVKDWHTPSEWCGFCASGKIKVSTNTLTVQWLSNDYIFESGGVL
jgi:hypothetical protein